MNWSSYDNLTAKNFKDTTLDDGEKAEYVNYKGE